MNTDDSKPDRSDFSLKYKVDSHQEDIDSEHDGVVIPCDYREIIPWDCPEYDAIYREVEEKKRDDKE